MSPDLFHTLVLCWIGLAAATFVLLFFVSAPYGRHARKGKGPAAIAFLVIWEAHYVHRSFFYPFMLSNPRPTPASIVAFGACFNLMNAAVNGYWLFFLADYPGSWLADPRFIAGAAVFAVGFVVNRWADLVLRKLRAPGETGYKIPRGGPWELVSSPNYLGEIMEWCSWALLTWSLAGLSFGVWTIANLAPRALTNHRWYRRQFGDYPAQRKALLPFVW